jgi:hypothetical protein
MNVPGDDFMVKKQCKTFEDWVSGSVFRKIVSKKERKNTYLIEKF